MNYSHLVISLLVISLRRKRRTKWKVALFLVFVFDNNKEVTERTNMRDALD